MAWNLWVSDANVASKCNSSPGWIAGFTSGETAEANKVNTALRQANLVAVALMDALGLTSYSYSTSKSTLQTAIENKLKINVNGTGKKLSETTIYAPTSPGTTAQVLIWNVDAPSWANINLTTVSLNGSVTRSPTFYAPTSSGTAGYILQSNGANNAPTWVETVPKATNATNANNATNAITATNAISTSFTNNSWISVHGTTPRVSTDNLFDGATYQIAVDEELSDNVGKPSGIFLFSSNSNLLQTMYRDSTDFCEIQISAGSQGGMYLSIHSSLYGEESQDASLKKFKYRRIQ